MEQPGLEVAQEEVLQTPQVYELDGNPPKVTASDGGDATTKNPATAQNSRGIGTTRHFIQRYKYFIGSAIALVVIGAVLGGVLAVGGHGLSNAQNLLTGGRFWKMQGLAGLPRHADFGQHSATRVRTIDELKRLMSHIILVHTSCPRQLIINQVNHHFPSQQACAYVSHQLSQWLLLPLGAMSLRRRGNH